MTQLRVFQQDTPDLAILASSDFAEIKTALEEAGIVLQRWEARHPVSAASSHEEILAAYRHDIDSLVRTGGYQSWDVVSMFPDHPDRMALREKFLSEHTHAEDEVRFFVDGQGLFTLHLGEKVYELLCTKGDLVSVPAGTPHWFDMGPKPRFTAIRLFNNPEGWVAQYTGSTIADRFSRLSSE